MVKRILGFDKLRFLMIICVVIVHSSTVFMDYAPGWFSLMNNERSITYTLISVILEGFIMSVLFFLSGYFAISSLRKKNFRLYFYDKFMHIGMPWILGFFLLCPFFYYFMSSPEVLNSVSFSSFLHDFYINYNFDKQGYFWFLGVLYLFFVVFGILVYLRPGIVEQQKEKTSPYIPIVLVIAITALSYYLSTTFCRPAEKWMPLGYIFLIQPARIIGYALCFSLGVYAKKHFWMEEGNWTPSQKLFIPLSILSFLFYLYKYHLYGLKVGGSLYQIIDAVSYGLYSVIISLTLIGFYCKKNRENWLSKNATYSYGVYWLHVILFAILYFLIKLDLPAFLKFLISIVATIQICIWVTRYVLKKLPFFKKIF